MTVLFFLHGRAKLFAEALDFTFTRHTIRNEHALSSHRGATISNLRTLQQIFETVGPESKKKENNFYLHHPVELDCSQDAPDYSCNVRLLEKPSHLKSRQERSGQCGEGKSGVASLSAYLGAESLSLAGLEEVRVEA